MIQESGLFRIIERVLPRRVHESRCWSDGTEQNEREQIPKRLVVSSAKANRENAEARPRAKTLRGGL